MGWFTWFKSAPKAVDDVLDKDNGLLSQFGGWIGRMDLTDEEVMKANIKTVSDVQEFVRSTLSESTARSKTRRDIAWMWIKTQLAIILLCAISAPWNMDLAEFYFKLGTCGLMLAGTSAIIIFHFGSYGLTRHNESKAKK